MGKTIEYVERVETDDIVGWFPKDLEQEFFDALERVGPRVVHATYVMSPDEDADHYALSFADPEGNAHRCTVNFSSWIKNGPMPSQDIGEFGKHYHVALVGGSVSIQGDGSVRRVHSDYDATQWRFPAERTIKTYVRSLDELAEAGQPLLIEAAQKHTDGGLVNIVYVENDDEARRLTFAYNKEHEISGLGDLVRQIRQRQDCRLSMRTNDVYDLERKGLV